MYLPFNIFFSVIFFFSIVPHSSSLLVLSQKVPVVSNHYVSPLYTNMHVMCYFCFKYSLSWLNYHSSSPLIICDSMILQHRMAGLAVIEIAQKVSKAWRIEWRNSNKGTAKNGKKNRRRERINMLSQNRGGAGCSTSSSSETSTAYASLEDRSSGRSTLSWQDVYSFAVRWRQISEPCDPVVWVNKLRYKFHFPC